MFRAWFQVQIFSLVEDPHLDEPLEDLE